MSVNSRAKLITVQGQARGGKGTIAAALLRELEINHSVYAIDQGQKFRVLAKLALDAGIDPEDLTSLESFIGAATTKRALLDTLADLATRSKDEIDRLLYTPEVNNASGMAGKLSLTQDVAVEVLFDEVRRQSPKYDVILIDGRAMQSKGTKLMDEGVVDYVVAIDVSCSPMTAAKRLLGLSVSADVDEYTSQQKSDLLRLVNDIDRRNSSDARRASYPSLPIRGAYEFDVLHQWTDANLEKIAQRVRTAGAIAVDNSYTRTKEQLTEPVVRLVGLLLREN